MNSIDFAHATNDNRIRLLWESFRDGPMSELCEDPEAAVRLEETFFSACWGFYNEVVNIDQGTMTIDEAKKELAGRLAGARHELIRWIEKHKEETDEMIRKMNAN